MDENKRVFEITKWKFRKQAPKKSLVGRVFNYITKPDFIIEAAILLSLIGFAAVTSYDSKPSYDVKPSISPRSVYSTQEKKYVAPKVTITKTNPIRPTRPIEKVNPPITYTQPSEKVNPPITHASPINPIVKEKPIPEQHNHLHERHKHQNAAQKKKPKPIGEHGPITGTSISERSITSTSFNAPLELRIGYTGRYFTDSYTYLSAEGSYKDFSFKSNIARRDDIQNGISNSWVSSGGAVPTTQTDNDVWNREDTSRGRMFKISQGLGDVKLFGGYSSDSDKSNETHNVDTNVAFLSNPGILPISLSTNTETNTETHKRTSIFGGSYKPSNNEIGLFSKYNVTNVKADVSVNGVPATNLDKTFRTGSFGSFAETTSTSGEYWGRAMLINNSGEDSKDNKKWEYAASLVGNCVGGGCGEIDEKKYYSVVISFGGDAKERVSDIRNTFQKREEDKVSSDGWLKWQNNSRFCNRLVDLESKATSFYLEKTEGNNYNLGASAYLGKRVRLASTFEKYGQERSFCFQPKITLSEKLSIQPYYAQRNDEWNKKEAIYGLCIGVKLK